MNPGAPTLIKRTISEQRVKFIINGEPGQKVLIGFYHNGELEHQTLLTLNSQGKWERSFEYVKEVRIER